MITKKECLATLFKAATLYKQNFLGNKYLVLYIDENRKPDFLYSIHIYCVIYSQ